MSVIKISCGVSAMDMPGKRVPEVLLLTAAIDTDPANHNNKRSSSHARRQDYINALDYYIHNSPKEISHILFCENTGADLSEFNALKNISEKFGKTLNFLSFKGKSLLSEGKGRCEYEILDTAHVWLASRFPKETPVWKITGRLIVKNFTSLVRSRPSTASVYMDLRSVPFIKDRLGGNNWAEMRVMSYTIEGYDRILKEQGPNCGRVTEKGLFQIVRNYKELGENIEPRFLVQPRFKGICGGSNKNYESMEYQMKDALRSFIRSVAPRIWL